MKAHTKATLDFDQKTDILEMLKPLVNILPPEETTTKDGIKIMQKRCEWIDPKMNDIRVAAMAQKELRKTWPDVVVTTVHVKNIREIRLGHFAPREKRDPRVITDKSQVRVRVAALEEAIEEIRKSPIGRMAEMQADLDKLASRVEGEHQLLAETAAHTIRILELLKDMFEMMKGNLLPEDIVKIAVALGARVNRMQKLKRGEG